MLVEVIIKEQRCNPILSFQFIGGLLSFQVWLFPMVIINVNFGEGSMERNDNKLEIR